MSLMDMLWILLCSGLVLLMQAGFMCLESGMTRSKNSINVAIKNLADFGLSVALFWGFGFAVMFGSSHSGWLGLGEMIPSLSSHPEFAVFFLYQAMFCGTATTIISGVAAERLRFPAYLILAALVSGLIYPLFGHWAWNGISQLYQANASEGWLEQLGFVDFAGSTVVHSIGAWVGLATILVVGARRGRFSPDGLSHKIQGSNMPFSVLGTLLLWFGWIGFNGGSTLSFNSQVPGIILNTMLAGVAGMLTIAILLIIQDGRVRVEPLMNGVLAGLVSITACANVVTNPIAVIIGATGAAVAILVAQRLEKWQIDDAVDGIAVHGGAGAWGTLCVALFGQLDLIGTGLTRPTQLLTQLLGIGTCLLWSLGGTWLLLKGLNIMFPLRISAEDEEIGLNVSEHHAKTETYELFQVMEHQATTHDLSLRVPVEPFTEMGHIATRYNQVMEAFESHHQRRVEDLAEIYYVTTAIVAAIENNAFQADSLGLEELVSRRDELGALARALQQLLQIIQQRDREIVDLRKQIAEKSQQNIESENNQG